MRKNFVFTMLLLLSVVAPFATFAADSFYISTKNLVVDDDSYATIAFDLDNSTQFYGFQVEVKLPEGLTAVKNGDNLDITLSSRADNSYSVNSNILANGTLIMGTFSGNHNAFSGNSGELFSLKVKVADEFVSGKVEIVNALFINSRDKDVALTATSATLGLELSSIYFTRTTLTMTVGDNTTFAPHFYPENAADKTLTWSSSDPAVASVSDAGYVEALAPGVTTVTATSANGLTAESVITVKAKTIAVTSIAFDKSSLELTEGDTEKLTVTFNPENATNQTLSWTSSDEDVATVSEYGVVTAVAAGSAVITASSANAKTATCSVTVAAKIILASEVQVTPANVELKAGETATLTAKVLPENTSDKKVTWKSEKEEVATVSTVNGKVTVTAKAIGETKITATCGTVSGVCAVKVIATPVDSITFRRKELKFDDQSIPVTLVPKFYPSSATDQTVTWKSSDVSVVTVSDTGEVAPVGEGTANVTATTANGKVATCVVTVSSDNIDVKEITLDKDVLDLAAGQTATLTATVWPDNATDQTVEWTSENDKIATVSDQGVVTAKASGTTIITATSSNGLHATCTVNVIVPATKVELDKTSVELQVNKTYTLTATVLPEDATDHNVTWTSANVAVATVVDGEITAKAIGETTITAACGDVKATCVVKVVPTPVESVKISLASLHLTAGDETVLTATLYPSGATDKSVTWTSSDDTVVTVSATGEVKALKAGNATITVTSSNGKTATCPVEVEALDIPVESVSISNTLNLTEGETATLTVTINPEDATDQSVEWTSSNTKVATVSAGGVVTAKAVGTAKITVASHNGKSATCTVTVAAKTIEVNGITLDVTEKTIEVGETLTLVATVTPSNASDATVTWSSDNEAVATVDQNGKVTTLAPGVAVITAKAGDKTAECTLTVSRTSVVALIGFDSNAPVKVYDLNGRYISDKVEGLAEGVYVIRQGDNAKKVNIR